MALGEEPPAGQSRRGGKERAQGENRIEHTDWSPQSIIALAAGVLATIALIAATAYAFTKGDSEQEAIVLLP